MIRKSKQKVYYEDEVIESVSCDKCKKEFAEEEDFYSIRVGNYYFEKGNKSLEDLETGYVKLLCEDCAKPIIDLLKKED